MPGLDAASTVDFLPLNHEFPIVEAFAGGTTVEAGDGTPATALSVSEGYFSTMGVPLLRGRVVTDRDDATAPPMVVISQPVAETLFGGLDALDRTIVLRSRSGAEHRYTVVGVVAGTRHGTLKDAADGHVYLPQQQQPTRVLRALVRATSNPAAQAATLREAVRRLDPQLAVTEVRTMDAVVEDFLAPEINVANALAEQSMTALLLALVGMYGVTAFAAARRSKEIGVRMALGASRGQILRLIVGQGVRTGASGIVIGLLAAYGLTRFLSPFVYGLNAADPVVFGGVAVVLFTCTVLACHLPARRASRLDPVHVLRTEG
jgi:putative ABC transport system permease protein